MSLRTIAGVLAAFEPLDEGAFAAMLEGLSLRERRLVIGAANFHTLSTASPVRLTLHWGLGTEFPQLTSQLDTRDILDRPTFASVDVVRAKTDGPVETGPIHVAHSLISHDSAILESSMPGSLYWRLRQAVEHRYPLQYDLLRQRILNRRERTLQSKPIPRRQLSAEELAVAPIEPVEKPRAVLIGLHWLDLGGAERWAVETVRLTREAGFIPIVVTDRDSHQPWITRSEFDGALVVPLSFPMNEDDDHEERFLAGLVSEFALAGVIVHHCAWLYDRLPRLRNWLPQIPVVDALHIIEYAGGGYPATGVHLDPYIDVHHVISPQLVDWMTGPQQVDSAKIVLAPLTALTTEQSEAEFKAPSSADDPLRLGFIGRFVRQKRPYLFLKLLRRLQADGVPFSAIMHGGGELDDVVRQRIHDYGLGDVVEVRDHEAAVSETLGEIDLLVVSSQNEGITLTTFEALAAGVPVLSADVGSQNTIVHDEMLVPRAPHDFVEGAASAIAVLAAEPAARRAAWNEEMARARAFSEHESANDWMRRTLQAWNA